MSALEPADHLTDSHSRVPLVCARHMRCAVCWYVSCLVVSITQLLRVLVGRTHVCVHSSSVSVGPFLARHTTPAHETPTTPCSARHTNTRAATDHTNKADTHTHTHQTTQTDTHTLAYTHADIQTDTHTYSTHSQTQQTHTHADI